jgi:hypothetical protein
MAFLSHTNLTCSNSTVTVAMYGADSATSCAEFYIKSGPKYILLGRDCGESLVASVWSSTQEGKLFIGITREGRNGKRMDYYYGFGSETTLRRTASTFLYK